MQFLKFWESQQPILHVKIELFYYYRKKSKKNSKYKIHRIFFGYESKQMPNAVIPKQSGAAQFKQPWVFAIISERWQISVTS